MLKAHRDLGVIFDMPDERGRPPHPDQSSDRLRRVSSVDLSAQQSANSNNNLKTILWIALALSVIACGFGVMQFGKLYAPSSVQKSAAPDKELEDIILRSSRFPNLVATLNAPKEKPQVRAAAQPLSDSTSDSSTAGRKKTPAAPKTPQEELNGLSGLSESRKEQALEDALRVQPQMMPARVQLIQMYAEKKDFEKARKLCQEGLQVSTQSGDKETFKILLGELHASPGG